MRLVPLCSVFLLFLQPAALTSLGLTITLVLAPPVSSRAGSESSEELSHIHLDSDACLLAVDDPARPSSADGAASAGNDSVAVILAFR